MEVVLPAGFRGSWEAVTALRPRKIGVQGIWAFRAAQGRPGGALEAANAVV